jgi:hypothetical protein
MLIGKARNWCGLCGVGSDLFPRYIRASIGDSFRNSGKKLIGEEPPNGWTVVHVVGAFSGTEPDIISFPLYWKNSRWKAD